MFSSLRNFHPLRVAASAGLKGALPKVLVGAALLGGGGSVLSAGSAQAACNDVVDFATWAGGTALECGDKKFTYTSSTSLPPNTNTTVTLGLSPQGDYLFNISFGGQTSFPNNYILNYDAIITDPHDFFTAVALSTNSPGFNPPAEDYTATFTGFSPSVVLSSINGSSASSFGAGEPTVLNVNNVFTSNGGTIGTSTTSYRQGTRTKVPGPLPLLGAGMAFGFSRKLRSRIKARVQA